MAGISIDDLITPASSDSFIAKMYSLGATLGLKTTAWQAGGITRTIIAILGSVFSTQDSIVSTLAHGGFLKFAAAVTPDPSIPGTDGTYPTAGVGWLDVCADSVYNVQRALPTYASQGVDLVNSTGVAYGPFAVGTYHLANPTTKKTYSNTTVLTIAASGTTTGSFIADEAGSASNSAASALVPVTSLVGVTVSGTSPGNFVGANAQSNSALLQQCLDKLAALGPKVGPDGAYAFFAKAASLPTTTLGGGGLTLAGGAITRVLVRTIPVAGTVQVYIANAAGAPSGPDVALIDAYLHAVCVPDTVTELTSAATNLSINVVVTVAVRAPYSAIAAAAVKVAITNYLDTLPIGGVDIDGLGTLGIPLEAVKGAIFGTVKASDGTNYIENILSITLNGSAASIAMSPTQVAKTTPTPTVGVTTVS